jgi:hypothetical protein
MQELFLLENTRQETRHKKRQDITPTSLHTKTQHMLLSLVQYGLKKSSLNMYRLGLSCKGKVKGKGEDQGQGSSWG